MGKNVGDGATVGLDVTVGLGVKDGVAVLVIVSSFLGVTDGNDVSNKSCVALMVSVAMGSCSPGLKIEQDAIKLKTIAAVTKLTNFGVMAFN